VSGSNYFAEQGGYDAVIAAVAAGYDQSDPWPYRVAKRLLDIGSACFGLALLAPLFPFIVLLIKLETPGPIFFRQRRVGHRGTLFDCYKFRSMVGDPEQLRRQLHHMNEATGAAFKIKDDPRITGVGRFLRRSSLDEFPQWRNSPRG